MVGRADDPVTAMVKEVVVESSVPELSVSVFDFLILILVTGVGILNAGSVPWSTTLVEMVTSVESTWGSGPVPVVLTELLVALFVCLF